MDTDVLNVGAGPAGLMLAGELCLAGVRPLVLERQPRLRETPQANGFNGQIVELLDEPAGTATLARAAASALLLVRDTAVTAPPSRGATRARICVQPDPQHAVADERARPSAPIRHRLRDFRGLPRATASLDKLSRPCGRPAP
jgi:flavin-dependent dehydrogenase